MKNLYKALANFQQEVPIIHQATKGFNYTYSDLKTILKVINPYMKKHGLGFTQLLEGSDLLTIIFHIESAESISSKVNIPQGVELKQQNTFQVAGSSISYFRRYALSSALGLVSDKDNGASGDEKEIATAHQEEYFLGLAEKGDREAMNKSTENIKYSKKIKQKARLILNQTNELENETK